MDEQIDKGQNRHSRNQIFVSMFWPFDLTFLFFYGINFHCFLIVINQMCNMYGYGCLKFGHCNTYLLTNLLLPWLFEIKQC